MCVQASQPEGFKDRYHTLPSTEVDGKDLRMETIRKDNLGKRITNSNKYSIVHFGGLPGQYQELV